MMKIPELKLTKKLLHKNRQKTSIHPWFFKNSFSKIDEDIEPGSIVKIFDDDLNFICYAQFNPSSNITARALSWNEDEYPNLDYLFAKIAEACSYRRSLRLNSNACRIFFSESDGIPGLIIDKYANYAVIQTNTATTDKFKKEFASYLQKNFSFDGIIERNDSEVRKLENLPLQTSVLCGSAPADKIVIEENSLKFYANLFEGQKTGFYLDQRENRMEVAKFAKEGMEILDCFCFSGAFSIYCLSMANNFNLTLVDESKHALELARENFSLNNYSANFASFIEADAFKQLRKFRDCGKIFDLIILDPPKLAPTSRDVNSASRAYKDINLLAIRLLRKGGILATFSCSSGMTREKFRQILFYAAEDAGRHLQILRTLGQAPDHPIPLNFPEAEYLKGFVCRVLG